MSLVGRGWWAGGTVFENRWVGGGGEGQVGNFATNKLTQPAAGGLGGLGAGWLGGWETPGGGGAGGGALITAIVSP